MKIDAQKENEVRRIVDRINALSKAILLYQSLPRKTTGEQFHLKADLNDTFNKLKLSLEM